MERRSMGKSIVAQRTSKKRILFMPNASSLAHVGRGIRLAAMLPHEEFDVAMAVDGHAHGFLPPTLKRFPATSLSPQEFVRRVSLGQPPYDEASLERQVQEDLGLLRAFKPDLVVGDFRLSLGVSASLMGVPYMNVVNAHWSPWAASRFVLPSVPDTRPLRWIPYPLVAALFQAAGPLLMKSSSRPLNRLRRRYGLAPYRDDVRDVYTSGDFTAYADIPELVPTAGAPETHRHIGTVLWDPPVPLPTWWDELPFDRPMVYLSAGSTGRADQLPHILRALESLDVAAVVATSGRQHVPAIPGRRWVADYLPGGVVCRRAQLVVNNGGTGGVYQALAAGVPVIGVAANVDQATFMGYVEKTGVGRRVLAGEAAGVCWGDLIREMLATRQTYDAARTFSTHIAGHVASRSFVQWVRDILGGDTASSKRFKMGGDHAQPASQNNRGPVISVIKD